MSSSAGMQGRLFWGLALTLLGVLFLLHNFYILDIGYVMSNFWPLILVLIGAKMILFPSKRTPKATTIDREPEPTWQQPTGAAATSADYLSENRFLGDLDVIIQSDDFKGGSASAFIGDLKFDLTKASVVSGTRTVVISGFIGDAMLKLPPNVPYFIQANAAIGDFKVLGAKDSGFGLNKSYKSSDYDSAAARLHVRISFFIGDITIF